ncbi:hypothetical protein DICVIV_12460, partial [Dictyocaulus viviparus]
MRSQITPLYELQLNPPLYERFVQLTHQCCAAARKCCRTVLSLNNQTTSGVCPATWDGWQCFHSTVYGNVVEGHCPSYIYGEAAKPDPSQKSRKICSETGWVSRPGKNLEWTDYSG